MVRSVKKQIIFDYVVLCPIFLIFSLLLSQWWDGHLQDFGAYWQAGYMVLHRQNVYNSTQWIAVRQSQGTALHSEPTFQYPLPLAVLFSPLALLPVQSAYILWMFFAQIAVLTSLVILLGFYPARSGYFELLTIAGIFMFRPMFSVVNSGQILTPLLLLLCISIWMFNHDKWFLGGFILSILALKPSVGFPMLILAGLWLLFRKQGRGILGMILGGLVLLMIGALVNYRWVIDYVNIGGNSFFKYYGMHPTLWGVVDKIFKTDGLSLAISFVCVVVILTIEAYHFWRNKSENDAFRTFAVIVPAALLMAPYSWNYDQVLLIVPIVFLMISISVKYATGWAAIFILGIVALAYAMLTVAYSVGHDVWSFMNSFVVWIFAWYFVTRSGQFQK